MARRSYIGFCSLIRIAALILLAAMAVHAELPGGPAAAPTTQFAPAVAPPTEPAAQGPTSAPAVSYDQIDQAITHGIDFLLSNFEKNELKHLDGEMGQIDHDGINDLCVYALLRAGESIHDPRLNADSAFVKGALDRMKHQRLDSNPADATPVVYARAMRAASLAAYHRPTDHKALADDVDWLIHAQRDGAYLEDDQYEVVSAHPESSNIQVDPTPGHSRYPTPMSTPGMSFPMGPIHHCIPSRGQAITSTPGAAPGGGVGHAGFAPTRGRVHPQLAPSAPTTRASQYPFDHFDSQIGLFGVSAGAEVGIEVPNWYWTKVQDHWLAYELANGQWYYTDFDYEPTIGMSWAGAWSLLATHDWLGVSQKPQDVGKQPYNAGLQQAIKWLETGDNSTTINDKRTMYVGYNLYVLDLIGRTSGFKFLGTHDWYREIAQRLVAVQWPNGAFGRSPYGIDPVIQTAYSLLFLSGGRNPVFIQKLRFDGAWSNRPRDLANVTRFASHELERSLNWQVVPLQREWTDWLDSPVLYIASHAALHVNDQDLNKLREYVQSGGMLLTHADAGSKVFTRYVEETLAPTLFPQYPMQDVPENDAIYSTQYHLKNPLPKLRGVRNGSRWLLVHSPMDLASSWQSRGEKSAKSSFELAVNLFIYAAGKGDLRNRVALSYLPEPAQTPGKSIDITRLQYGGNWDPEPQAWVQFDRWMQSTTSTGLQVKTSPLADLKPGAAPLAVVTGTADYTATDPEIAAMKSFVEAGGWLLIDDCGGSGSFSDAVQTKWLPKLTEEKLTAIADDDPLLSGVSPKYREGTAERAGANYKPLSVTIGKGRIIYSPIDITTGLLGANTCGIVGYKPASAMSFAKNIVTASANH